MHIYHDQGKDEPCWAKKNPSIHLDYVSRNFPKMRMQILKLTLLDPDIQDAGKDYERARTYKHKC